MKIKSSLLLFYSLFFSLPSALSSIYPMQEKDVSAFQQTEEVFDSIKREIRIFRDEFLKPGVYEAEVIDKYINRFCSDLDLLIWDGFTVTDKRERLIESLQELTEKENDLFRFLYKQYEFIMPLILEKEDVENIRSFLENVDENSANISSGPVKTPWAGIGRPYRT